LTNPYDRSQAIVIGASAAGLYTAYLLAKGGMPVLLFDEREGLGMPPRTLIVTHRIKDVLGPTVSEAVVNRTPRLQLNSAGRSTTIRLNQPDLIVEREKLIRMLADQARAAGVELLRGHRCLSVERDGDGLVVSLESPRGRLKSIRTRILVGADGVYSKVAKAAQRDSHRTVSILQAAVAMPKAASSDTTQVWFDPRSTRYFYWLIPESQDRAVVGLIADDQHQAREALERFLSAQGLEPMGYQGAHVSLYARNSRPWNKLGEARVFLVGDAAAHVKVTTVGGVVTGLWGAQAAARAILRGSSYGQELTALRRELGLHLLIRGVLNHLVPGDYDELLGLMTERARGALASRSRDEAWRVLLSSLAAQPRLLLLGARTLFRHDGAS
jgi:digeranylgeranylglycerophospholipid reductase